MQLDDTDWDIIDRLSEQYEMNTALARALGVSEGMIRQRLKRLQDQGIIRVRALRNPEVLSNQQLAYVTVNLVESRLLDEKAQQLAALENVLSVAILSGQYDLMLEVLVDSNKGLIRFLVEQLSGVEGIAKTETLLVLKSYDKWI